MVQLLMESLAISVVKDDPCAESCAERLSKASQTGSICLVATAQSTNVSSPAASRAIIFGETDLSRGHAVFRGFDATGVGVWCGSVAGRSKGRSTGLA